MRQDGWQAKRFAFAHLARTRAGPRGSNEPSKSEVRERSATLNPFRIACSATPAAQSRCARLSPTRRARQVPFNCRPQPRKGPSVNNLTARKCVRRTGAFALLGVDLNEADADRAILPPDYGGVGPREQRPEHGRLKGAARSVAGRLDGGGVGCFAPVVIGFNRKGHTRLVDLQCRIGERPRHVERSLPQ